MTTYVLILAGGESRRMNGINKQFTLVGGIPVIIKSALAFENAALVDGIVIAARECDIPRISELCGRYGITKLKKLVPGGSSRTGSARNAFAAAGGADIIMVHDGARPFVSDTLIALNDSLPDPYYNAGTCYLNKALKLHPLREKKQLKATYQKARHYMERYRQLAPEQKQKWGPALYRIYLNLNMGKQFDEIDRLLK